MASATAPKVGHIFDPISDETITDEEGIVELVITDRTEWQALCNEDVLISNQEYRALFDGFDVLEDCEACRVKAREEDPLAYIYDV